MRPPALTLAPTTQKKSIPTIELETDSSPATIITGWEDGYTSPLSSASPLPSPTTFRSPSADTDEISKEYAALDQLRRNVQKNLRLRPIRSQGKLPKVDLSVDPNFTPPWDPSLRNPETPKTSYFTPDDAFPPTAGPSTLPPPPPPPVAQPATSTAIAPKELHDRLIAPKRPLVIDIRPSASHASFRIRHSVNVAIPTLILKRSRKPGGALQSLDSLRQYIPTEDGRRTWDETVAEDSGCWDGDVVVYDEEMDEKGREKENAHMGWALLAVLRPLLKNHGRADYLAGGIAHAGHDPDLQTLIDSEATQAKPKLKTTGGGGGGLFQLNTTQTYRAKSQLDLEPPPPSSKPALSPLPLMPSFSSNNNNLMDSTPSPPPSHTRGYFRKPVAPSRKPSLPSLQKLDTTATTKPPPKLSLRTQPIKSATLAVPPSSSKPSSPSHLTLTHSNLNSYSSSSSSSSSSPSSGSEGAPDTGVSAYFTPPHTPLTPRPSAYPSTPLTARPPSSTTSEEEEEFPEFGVSTILPGFLFLGPELTAPEHVAQLKNLGVRQIMNLAVECNDDLGLRLGEVFDRYVKIGMRDTVKEENISKGVKEACEILDDARLHTVPTYVHCKAGKSRSVTAVMAYLIHANHWTLSRAYQFVLERRKGISPNIGFVLELMTFEEQELGSKSHGVQPVGNPSSHHNTSHHTSSHSHPSAGKTASEQENRRGAGAHVRESLPPPLTHNHSAGGILGGGWENGQEMEVKDASGRYRHVRRAPVDETTLQPTRRVSKAGLESFGTESDN